MEFKTYLRGRTVQKIGKNRFKVKHHWSSEKVLVLTEGGGSVLRGREYSRCGTPFWIFFSWSTWVLTGQILGIFAQFRQFSRFQAIFSSNFYDGVDKNFPWAYIFRNFFQYLSQFPLFLMTKAQLSKKLCPISMFFL